MAQDRDREPDPRTYTLDEWKRLRGTRTGTMTINGATYTDLNEVEWRETNGQWLGPDDK